MDKPEELLDNPQEVTIPLETPKVEGLSESVAASVAAAQAALEDSMTKASAIQMTAMQTAIAEFKSAAEEVRGLSAMLTAVLSQVEDLKLEALELVEALTPQANEGQEGQSDGGRIDNSTVQKPKHIQIMKKILSR
jgi:DNA anti-recombination protein RmuC